MNQSYDYVIVDKIYWKYLSCNSNKWLLLEKNQNNINWDFFSQNQDKINWKYLSYNPNERLLLNQNQNNINWDF
jgi:hypothetical protein